MLYEFQTLITWLIAIGVAVAAAVPVWRQLRDSNLQTRISHRETLANLLRSALRRYKRVDDAIAGPLRRANEATRDPIGEAMPIGVDSAFQLESECNHLLDWYLVVLSGTENADIEEKKLVMKTALDTLGTAHWADHNDQYGEKQEVSDEDWAKVLAGCAEAKIDAASKVGDVQWAYRELTTAQQAWVQSLRTRFARLDLTLSAPCG